MSNRGDTDRVLSGPRNDECSGSQTARGRERLVAVNATDTLKCLPGRVSQDDFLDHFLRNLQQRLKGILDGVGSVAPQVDEDWQVGRLSRYHERIVQHRVFWASVSSAWKDAAASLADNWVELVGKRHGDDVVVVQVLAGAEDADVAHDQRLGVCH